MSDLERLDAGPRLSRAVIHDGVIHFAGITAKDRTQDIAGQTRQALEALDGHLARAGSDKTRLLSVYVLMREVDRDFAAMNEVWEAWVVAGQAPARATWQAKLAAPAILIELVATAAVSPAKGKAS